jgi:protein kinase-like protein
MRCRECNAELPVEAKFCLSCGERVQPTTVQAAADPLLEALDKAIGFQYRIERLLGRGGMGAVYLAHELALDRDVAIKVLPPDQANTGELRERFKREARTAARLSHPNIVPLYTFGEVSGLLYFVMAYVAGESLAGRLRRTGPLDSEATCTLLAAVCDALDYAHRQGIVHRDIKPDNILIDAESDTPRLTDFGIARLALADAQLTSTGQLIGTPHYMSPEQAMGRSDVGPRSDLYSLGVMAFEMLSGQHPFRAETPLDALMQRLTQDPVPLRTVAPGVRPELALAIGRCLARDPADRWPDAKSLREALAPGEEEVEDPQLVNILRTILTIAIPVMLIVFAHFRLIVALHPHLQVEDRLTAMFAGMFGGITIVAAAVAVRLRLEGFDAKSIALKSLQQPRWWRSWYPPTLRRRGDVWDRLPREFRQSRIYRGLFQMFVLAVFMPLMLITTWDRQLPVVGLSLTLIAAAGLVVLFVLRRRAVRGISARLGATSAEALAILNTPSWRVSTWRRRPAAALLTEQPAMAVVVERNETTSETLPAGPIDAQRSRRPS